MYRAAGKKVRSDNGSEGRRKAGLIRAAIGFGFVLVMFAFITLSWFTFSKQLEAGGMFIKTSDPSIDCTATSYYYIRSQGNTYAPQEDTEDNRFELMQYDSLFGGNNTHTYVVERMELTASDLPENGTLNFTMERETSQASDMPGSDYISSVTCYTFVTLPTFPTFPTTPGAILSAVNEAAADTDFVTRTFVVNDEKADMITFSVPYTSENWTDGKLYIYLHIDYDETLITEYIDKSLRNLLKNNGSNGQVDVEYGADVTMQNDIQRIVISR